MTKQLEALIARAKHIVENGGLLARDTSLQLIAALEQAQQQNKELESTLEREREKSRRVMSRNHQLEASPLAIAPALVDQICLTASGIHNLGRGVDDDKAQSIIDDIRTRLESATASPLAVKLPGEINPAQARHLFSIEIDEEQANAAADGWNSCLKAIRAAGGTIQTGSPSDGAIYAAYGNKELKAQVEETLRNIGTVEGE